MGHQRKMGIYVGYDSPSIVRYLEPLIEDFFTACFVDCHFDETIFLLLGGYKHANIPVEHHELSWYALIISHLDPCTTQFETEVQPIIDLQSIAQSMSDAFNDLTKVTRSHILITNAPAMIDVPCRGRPFGSKDSQPQKRKMAPTSDPSLNSTIAHSFIQMHEVILDYGNTSYETCQPPKNCEISVYYAVLDDVWNWNKMIVDDAFAYSVSTNITFSDDIEPRSVDEC
ncbi:hypothetical protein ACFXTN_004365 [Malus domestica]